MHPLPVESTVQSMSTMSEEDCRHVHECPQSERALCNAQGTSKNLRAHLPHVERSLPHDAKSDQSMSICTCMQGCLGRGLAEEAEAGSLESADVDAAALPRMHAISCTVKQ